MSTHTPSPLGNKPAEPALIPEQSAPARAESSPLPPPSKGETLFNWTVYGGIAGVGTFLATIPMAYWQKYQGGARWYQSAAEGLAKIGLPKGTTEKVLETTSLMHGGNLMLIPVTIAEHHKKELVEKANTVLGNQDNAAALKDAPEQTVGSLIKGRLAAWCAVFVGLSASAKAFPSTFKIFEEEFGKRVCQVMGKTTHLAGEETRAFRLGKIAAIDSIATVAASTILFFGSHFFAKRRHEKLASQEVKRDAAPIVALPKDNKTGSMAHAETPEPSEKDVPRTELQEVASAMRLQAAEGLQVAG